MTNFATLPAAVEGPYSSIQTERLAVRLEQGAQALADFARSLSAEQWCSRMPGDGRMMGVIVHHVACMYPAAMQLVQQLAAGQAITGVTSADIDAMNAKHASENGAITKAEALTLLAHNSAAAADAIRALCDEELAQAAPVSLYGDAPVTCQFILEEHAVRHSYHHLSLMRRALGREEEMSRYFVDAMWGGGPEASSYASAGAS